MNKTTYKTTYEKLTYPFRKHPFGVKAIKALNKAATWLVYFAYPLLLIILFMHHDARFWRILLTPAISFVAISLFRKLFNAPRPYEVLDIDPIIPKNTKGKSFPSRHVFSIFVISMAFYYVCVPLGICLMIIGALLAAIRVIGGVHFPKDVISGIVIGIACGIIGFFII